MESYQINDLERLTGIKAHTIRIWEKRFGLISPQRTETNRRYYDGEQVKKLLNVTTLLSHGLKISHIAELSDQDMRSQIEQGAEKGGAEWETSVINDMVAAMLAFDELSFERMLMAAVLRVGLYDTMLRVVYPFLRKAGMMWSIDRAAPVQEHFASCIVRQKLLSAIDGVKPPAPGATRCLLFLPPAEWHEVGLLFTNYVLRANGFHTLYLGQNVPESEIKVVSEAWKPQVMLTFFITSRPGEEMIHLLKQYRAVGESVKLLVMGNPDLQALVQTMGAGYAYLERVEQLIPACSGL